MKYGPVADIAMNLARNRGWSVFPCGRNKRPTCTHGFKDAASDQAAVITLWKRHPGPLIGIATGAISRLSVLDIDVKHDAARAWWQVNHARIPITRTFKSYSGGLHFYFQHTEGIRNTQGKLCHGIDTRGTGGYIIHWFAFGRECVDHSPLAPWPRWLLTQLLPQKSPPSREIDIPSEQALEGVLRRISGAKEGERNALLFWGACRFGEHVRAGLITRTDAETLLVAAGLEAGQNKRDARATVRSGLTRGTQHARR